MATMLLLLAVFATTSLSSLDSQQTASEQSFVFQESTRSELPVDTTTGQQTISDLSLDSQQSPDSQQPLSIGQRLDSQQSISIEKPLDPQPPISVGQPQQPASSGQLPLDSESPASDQPQKEEDLANDKFTQAFYEVIRNEAGNIFFSPTGILATLAMIYAGAGGGTAQQLRQFALMPESKDKAAQHFGGALKAINSDNANVTVLSANAFFTQENFQLKKDFVDLLKRGFQAQSFPVNFNAKEATVTTINQFVTQHTNNFIKDFATEDFISEDTVLVLVNALYFKAKFENAFPANKTRKGKFHLNKSQSQRRVDFMEDLREIPYEYRPDLKAHILELPYAGGEMSMVCVVPSDIEGLKEVEPKLKDGKFSELRPDAENMETVRIRMPKFQMKKTIQLKSALETMGLTDMFDETRANLSSIADGKLFVSKFMQKTAIEVNEEGTTAAAATAAAIDNRISSNPSPVTVTLDRPFLFYIVHKPSTTILFSGRLSAPQSKSN